MQSGRPSLLDVAMKSLETNATLENQNRKNMKNDVAVSNIGHMITKRMHNSLVIKPCIEGNSESTMPAAIEVGPSFMLDMSKLMLPAQCGGTSLESTIRRLCNEYDINAMGNLSSITCTPVTTLLSGQYDRADVDCTGTTQAEFVPAFYGEGGVRRAVALCFSLNGETKLRLDHVKVVNDYISCLDNASGSKTALRAIEIPNDIAKDLSTQNPGVFEQLKKNACIVVHLSYNLEQPHQYHGGLGMARGGDGFGVTRGQGGFQSLGAQFESLNAPVSMGGPSSGVSAYSVVGQGSQVRDRHRTVTESGVRTLDRIQVYLVGAVVLNTHEMTLNEGHYLNVRNLMKARAQELGEMFSQYKVFTYDDLVESISQHCQQKQYGITTEKTDIFEHALLRLGNINHFPCAAKFSISRDNPRYIDVSYNANEYAALDHLHALMQRFGQRFCEISPQVHVHAGMTSIRIPLAEIAKIMPLILQTIDSILESDRAKMAYRLYSQNQARLYDKVVANFKEIFKGTALDVEKSECTEITFVKMFGCTEELKAGSIIPGNGYIGRMTETQFLLGISAEAAIKVVSAINAKYGEDFAYLGSTRVFVPRKGNIPLCEINVFSGLLCTPQFIADFKAYLAQLMENEPVVIEKLRIQSGTQKTPAAAHGARLQTSLSVWADSTRETIQKDNLYTSVANFMVIASSPTSTHSQRMAASFQLSRCIAGMESIQGYDENRLFKKGFKKTVKEVQYDMGLRPGK